MDEKVCSKLIKDLKEFFDIRVEVPERICNFEEVRVRAFLSYNPKNVKKLNKIAKKYGVVSLDMAFVLKVENCIAYAWVKELTDHSIAGYRLVTDGDEYVLEASEFKLDMLQPYEEVLESAFSIRNLTVSFVTRNPELKARLGEILFGCCYPIIKGIVYMKVGESYRRVLEKHAYPIVLYSDKAENDVIRNDVLEFIMKEYSCEISERRTYKIYVEDDFLKLAFEFPVIHRLRLQGTESLDAYGIVNVGRLIGEEELINRDIKKFINKYRDALHKVSKNFAKKIEKTRISIPIKVTYEIKTTESVKVKYDVEIEGTSEINCGKMMGVIERRKLFIPYGKTATEISFATKRVSKRVGMSLNVESLIKKKNTRGHKLTLLELKYLSPFTVYKNFVSIAFVQITVTRTIKKGLISKETETISEKLVPLLILPTTYT